MIRSMKDLFNEPRLDADGREERYRQIVQQNADKLWEKLADEYEAEKFIDAYVPAPETALLANIIARIADAQLTLAKPGIHQRELKLAVCEALVDDISNHIERVAEMHAEQIFYPRGE